MHTTLEDKVILVTGATSAAGRATATALARAGARVVIADADVEGGQAAVRAIAHAGGRACHIATDLRLPARLAEPLDYLMRRYGRLDAAFNVAGIGGGAGAAPTDHDEAGWDQVMDMDLRGLWLRTKLELASMRRQGAGVIVNHAPVSGPRGNRLVAAVHIAGVHGLQGLTLAAALRWSGGRIRIDAICTAVDDDHLVERVILGTDGRRPPAASAGTPGARPTVADTVVRLCAAAAP